MQLSDLPDELKLLILMYTNYEHQQRLVRVCRHYKYLIGNVLDHVCLNYAHRNCVMEQEDSRALTPSRPGWKYRCEAVHTIIYDGRFRMTFNYLPGLNSVWLQRFPCFDRLNLVNCQFPSRVGGNILNLTMLSEWDRLIRFTVHNSFVAIFPPLCTFKTLWETEIGPMSYEKACYKRCATLTFDSNDLVSAFFHGMNNALCSDADARWIAKYVPNFDPDLSKRIIAELGCSEKDGTVKGPSCHVLQPIKRCKEHSQFLCLHRDGAFYRDHFTGRVLNLFQLVIRRLKLATEEPPCRDQFYEMVTYPSRDRRSQLYGPRCATGVW